MARILYAAAPWWSGLRHRFRSISQAKIFADYAGYHLSFLWGVSEGVAYCRYEDILAASSWRVRIINVAWKTSSRISSRSTGLLGNHSVRG